jgi:hypothetical protein
MRNPLIVLVLPLCAAIGAAQTIVIPNGMASTEGNTSNAFPWGRGGTGLKIQNVYDSTNFTLQGVNFPVAITRLRWRPNTSASSLASSYATGATVKLSTCPVDQNSVTANFAANEGADLTTVWTGPVSWPAAAVVVGPCPFLIDLPLQTPFIYDPNAGDLNIETDLPIQTFTGTGLQLDVQSTGSLSSRVFMSTGYPAGTVSTTLNHGVVVEVTYAPAAGYASAAPYGTGCYNASTPPDYASFYENFATAPAFDLGGSSMTMVPAIGGGYTVIPGISPYVAPTGAATALALTDDSITNVTLSTPFPCNGGPTTTLEVCSNGFVSLPTGNGTGFTPAVGTFLNATKTGWWNWHDFNPSIVGSGLVKYEEVGSISYITWDGVWDFGGTTVANASNWQLQFDRSTGTVTWAWTTMSTLGNGFLVGFSPGGGSGDPGNRDISATLPGSFSIQPADLVALANGSSARPILGTTINLLTTHVPASAAFGADILSFTQFNPGIDLTILGMPGCRQFVGLDTTLTFFPVSGTGSVSLFIPNVPVYAGLHLYSQGAAFVAGVNPLGALASNGVDLKLDIN